MRTSPRSAAVVGVVLLFTGAVVPTLRAQEDPLAWPRVTNVAKPWARWWWQGSAVDVRDLSAEMQKYAAAGLGGLELTPIYGVRGQDQQFIPFLSPAWVEALEYTLREGKRLGLGIDMATGTGWPFGGPSVGDDAACKNFAIQTYRVDGGGRLADPVRMSQKPLARAAVPGVRLRIDQFHQPIGTTPNLQQLAPAQVRFERPMVLQALTAHADGGESVDLTAKVGADGKLDWVAPPGQWRLYALFQGWHGKLVERAAPGGEGDVIDHFSGDALRSYLKRFDDALVQPLPLGLGRPELGAVRAFFNDSYEVDDAAGQSNWTPKFFDEFQKRRGYDLRNHLAALAGDDTDADRAARVVHDFRETISDLLLDEFTVVWRDWAAKRGALVRNQSHGSPANILDLYAASDIPETEGADVVRMKFASSAANVSGKQLASAETVTWLDEHFTSSLADVKRTVDFNFLGGINHVVYHGLAFSPASEPWPGRLFYAAVHLEPTNPQWDDFAALNAYVARVQSFLQSTRPHNDVLLYYPIHDAWSVRGKEMLVHVGGGHDVGISLPVAKALLDAGHTYDMVSDRQLAEATFDGGKIRTTGGAVYRAIVVPGCRYMPLETWRKLAGLSERGAAVIVLGKTPEDVPGWAKLDERRQQFKELSARANRMTVGGELEPLLSKAGVKREMMVDKGLAFTRRRHETGDVYFIVNRGEAALDGWVPLRSAAKRVGVFDPMRGTSGVASSRAGDGGATEVYVQIDAGESIILKTFESDVRAPDYAYTKAAGDPRPLDGAWTVTFTRGGPELPAARETKSLGSWTNFDGDAYKAFSGTATYTASFDRPRDPNDGDWLIDLGQVAESARVRVNGTDVATLIAPPFKVRIAKEMLRDRNTLEVAVSNLATNRIIDMDKRGVPYKRFYNVNFPPLRKENRGPDGLFDASKWTPRESGLIGPVTLTPIAPLRPLEERK